MLKIIDEGPRKRAKKKRLQTYRHVKIVKTTHKFRSISTYLILLDILAVEEKQEYYFINTNEDLLTFIFITRRKMQHRDEQKDLSRMLLLALME